MLKQGVNSRTPKFCLRCALVLSSLLVLCLARADVTLRMVVWDGSESLKVLRHVLNDFEKQHPGIHVKLDQVDYGTYFQKLLAQYAAHTAPDVAMMNPENFQRYAKRGAMLPLNDLVASTPGFDLSTYYKPIVDAHSYQKQLYVLPRDIAPMGLIYYNKRLFREVGLDLPDGTWTWDFVPHPELGSHDFITCMEKLTKRDASNKVTTFGFSPASPGFFADTLTYSTGARYVDDPEAFTKLLYDDPRVIKAYTFLTELMIDKNYIPTAKQLNSVFLTQARNLFISQKLAMFQSGIWEVPDIRKALIPNTKDFFDWDITLAPGYRDPATGKVVHAFPTGGSGYSIMSSTTHKDLAWELVRWMAGPPGMSAMAKAGIAQPAIKTLALGPDWIPGPNTPLEQQYPHSRIFTHIAVDSVVFAPTAEYGTEVLNIAGAKIGQIYEGSLDAKSGLLQGQAEGTARLVDILKQENLSKFSWPVAWTLGLALLAGLIYWIFKPDLGKKLSLTQKSEAKAGFGFVAPWLIGVLLFTVGPMILSLLMSATDWDFITPAKARGFGNFEELLFRDPRFWISLKVTFIYTLVSVPLGITASLALALLLNVKVRGVPIYRTCFYLPSLASAVASSLIWQKVFQQDGGILNMALEIPCKVLHLPGFTFLVDGKGNLPNWLGESQYALPALILMSIWGIGPGMIILLAGLKNIPEYYFEAASLDGASPWQKFRVITVPMISPAILFTMVTGMIGSFQSFTQAYILSKGTGGPDNATRFYMLHLYDAAFNNLRMGYSAALAWVLFLIIFVASMGQLRLNRHVHYEGSES